MNQGIKRLRGVLRRLPLIALAMALPAASMTRTVTSEAPAPSVGQRVLIEAHDTTGIGWWSSSGLETAPDIGNAAVGSAAAPTPAPTALYPKRVPGVETY